MIAKKVLKTLEYDKILERLKGFAGSERGKARILELYPSCDFEEVSRLLCQTAEADRLLYEFALNISFCFDDIEFVIERAEKSALLTMDEVLKIGRVLKTARLIKSAIAAVTDRDIVLLKEKANLFYTDKGFEEKIFGSIISPFEMSDNASGELRNIRQKIKKCNEEIRTALNRFTASAQYQKYLQDNVITVRGDRYVILLKSEFKGAIPGLIHGQSSTGSTLYVEPMAVFELNNKLKSFLSDETFEIERILRAFTSEIGANAGLIRYGFELMTDMDIIFAKAAYAKSVGGIRPKLINAPSLDIVKGRHPLIDKAKVVPISLNIGRSFDILMITGPNTGGKTVTLKLAGLFALMTQTGLFISAHEDSVMGIFDGVYSDIGDEQSIEQSLSTFSSHMTNIIGILKYIDGKSLVLLDELGAGTDPTEGAALALAITEYLKTKRAKAVITTHYNELKEFSLTEEGLENASMDFDPDTFAPAYHLIIGIPGASNAIRIAERLGLESGIAKKAKSLIGDDRRQFERIILSAETARKNALISLEDAEKTKKEAITVAEKTRTERAAFELEREKFRQGLKKDAKDVLEKAEDDAREILERMKELSRRADDEALFEARRLNKRLSDAAAKTAEIAEGRPAQVRPERERGEPAEGDAVFVESLRAKGRLISLSKSGALIEIGELKTHVKLTDIVKIKPPSDGKQSRTVSVGKALNTAAVASEIMLIGKNVDEALYLLEDFIDRAVMGGLSEVRIIHGVGTGKLGRGIQDYLKTHKNTVSYRYGRYGEGERGVTILTIV